MSFFGSFRRHMDALFDEFERQFFNDPFFREPFADPFFRDPFAGPLLTGPESNTSSSDTKSSAGSSDSRAVAPAERREFGLTPRFPSFPSFRAVPMDVVESKTDYRVSLDVPGVKPEEIKIECKDGVLTISGARKHERKDENENYRYMERSYGSFSRSFRLPKDVDQAKISAHHEDGVLRLTLPKLPQEQSTVRQIPITPRSGSA